MSYAKYENWKQNRLQRPPQISVVITTYNDEAHILYSIDRIGSFMCGLHYDWELIVCDGASKDSTLKLVSNLKYANLVLLKAKSPHEAAQRAVLRARGGLILFEDINDSTPIEEANRLLPVLVEKNADLVIGSRIDTRVKSNGLLQRLLSAMAWLRRMFLGLFFHQAIYDPDYSFRLYSAPAARRLFTFPLKAGISPSLEVLYLAARLKYKIVEIPVGWASPGRGGATRRRNVFQLLPDLLQIVIKDLTGRYKKLKR